MTQEEMEKEAMLNVIKGALSIGKSLIGKGVSGTAKAVSNTATAPARGLWGMAKRKPVMAGLTALTVAGAAGQARQEGRGHATAMKNINAQGRARTLGRRQQTLYGGKRYAQTSGF